MSDLPSNPSRSPDLPPLGLGSWTTGIRPQTAAPFKVDPMELHNLSRNTNQYDTIRSKASTTVTNLSTTAPGSERRSVDNPAYCHSDDESDESEFHDSGINGYGTRVSADGDAKYTAPQDAQVKEDRWDVFQDPADESEWYQNDACYLCGKRFLRVLFALLSLLVILTGAVVSKLALLYVASNANVYLDVRRSDPSHSNTAAANFLGKYTTNTTCGIPFCTYSADQMAVGAVRWLWALWLCMSTPYLYTLLRTMWNMCFKKKRKPSGSALVFVLIIESLHTTGLCILLFAVFPYLDSFRDLLIMNSVFLLPSIQNVLLLPSREDIKHKKPWYVTTLDALAFTCQLVAMFFWWIYPVSGQAGAPQQLTDTCSSNNMTVPDSLPDNPLLSSRYLIPVALFLISFSWWDNFVDSNLRLGGLGDHLRSMHREVRKCKTKLNAAVSAWKIVLSFCYLMIYWAVVVSINDFQVVNFSTLFDESSFLTGAGDLYDDWLAMWAIQVPMGIVLLFSSDAAVKAMVQICGFSVPLAITTPISFFILATMCHECNSVGAAHTFNDFYWNCFYGYDDMANLTAWTLYPVGFIWWASQLWIGGYIWTPKAERLAKTDKIFVTPLYCGCLLEQSLMFMRRRNDEEFSNTAEKKTTPCAYVAEEGLGTLPVSGAGHIDPIFAADTDREPYIFCCTTMWHETADEMIQILKSLFRLDYDQSAREKAIKYFHITDPDFYRFEVHVLFDDAFEAHGPFDHDYSVNKFVTQLNLNMNKAAKLALHLDKDRNIVKAPELIETPYGGRLTYVLPGGNLMLVHLKDKEKIRHRKRWSQVMYMYYLLGFRLWSEPVRQKRRELRSENTYILALDGDVDFKPEAVLLLVDLLKRNAKVGAACGRIHPTGSGPTIWYQKFEYAVSHWLQKSTEHVLGCVLCSPGCFSLFRGSALMEDNVMKTYSKKPVTPIEHVQYDQGEDRWLCTLLLQRGYRVEFSAAADALTNAPEGFAEFFNQRKRWSPSTFANILDLLGSGAKTVRNNENISWLYIIYQGFLLCASVIGPATIMLMIVSALTTTTGMSQGIAFLIVFIPVISFFIIALTCKQQTQLMWALILSGLLTALMMVEIVSVLIALFAVGLCDPTSLFLVFILGTFVLAALLHPTEGYLLIHLLIYFLAIPTTYLILIIYALCNMNDISWGTRESPDAAKEEARRDKELTEQYEAERAAKELAARGGVNPNKKSGEQKFMAMFGFSSKGASDGTKGGLGDCFKFSCGCCLKPGQSTVDQTLEKLAIQVCKINQDIKAIGKKVKANQSDSDSDSEPKPTPLTRSRTITRTRTLTRRATVKAAGGVIRNASVRTIGPPDGGQPAGTILQEEDLTDMEEMNPKWMENEHLGEGAVNKLSHVETSFWVDLIKKYLEPLAAMSLKEQEQKKKELRELRNRAVAGFFIIDGLLIVFIEALYIAIATGAGAGLVIHYNCTNPIAGNEASYEIDPIGVLFMVVFGSIILLQVIGMCIHRWFSLLQIVSSTVMCSSRINTDNLPNLADSKTLNVKDAVMLAKEMQRVREDEEFETTTNFSDEDNMSCQSSNYGTISDNVARSKSIGRGKSFCRTNVQRIRPTVQPGQPDAFKTLDDAFARRFMALKNELDAEINDTQNTDGGATNVRGTKSRPGLFSFKGGAVPSRSILRRKSTVHAQLKYRHSEIFTDEAARELKQQIRVNQPEAATLSHSLGGVAGSRRYPPPPPPTGVVPPPPPLPQSSSAGYTGLLPRTPFDNEGFESL